ncbi:hypothetical protein M975_3240 [Buttiauxella brennerae ATCC 51605]|uniref:DUF3289 family protein n=1 Tax=Buttiauxella brennerae ATCC 51605 TaxID=1354251 RepID=A0A1B7IJN9_9ENTR|nr:DUF3289 family protein [Buttiauxella brennerae]OAT29702.1 hypothetical protein M975_3240 [Buttiauxella brennerae ATCC 51605]
MNLDMVLSMNLPCKIFSTFHHFNDNNTDDMQYGGLSNHDFKILGLNDISAKVDPFRLLQFDTASYLNRKIVGFGVNIPPGRPISRTQCAAILFMEMKELSTKFAWGKYKNIISELIDNFQYGKGASWHSIKLDLAYQEIVEGTGTDDTLRKITQSLDKHFFLKQKASISIDFIADLRRQIEQTRLPKFNRFQDKYNGLGVSVHDVHAQEIELVNFCRYAMSWNALLRFKAQDHFGLGKEDIINPIYRSIRFFRIWFFLQHHRDYAYKPFFTNFTTHTNIRGGI